MSAPALSVLGLSKSFLVPAAPRGAVSARPRDPRREPHGRRRDRLHVLRDVSFEVAPGEAIGIVGANGSGKSTLLKLLAGIGTPDSGGFETLGSVGALLEVGAGFHPDLTGADNLRLAGSLAGLSGRELDRRLPAIIAFSELERFMDMPVKHYSTGMVVRLGFAAAIQMEPDILLLDETFAVGDARFQHRALGRVRERKAAGRTLLLVSHSAELLLELADRAIWLDAGRVALDGPTEEVLAAYRRSSGEKLTGSDRLRNRLFDSTTEACADSASTGEPNVRGAIRIEGARVSPRELGSADSLLLEFELRVPPGIADAPASEAPEARIEVLFLRDDRRAVARSIVPAPVREKDLDAGTDPEAESRIRGALEFAPVRLSRGDYAIHLSVMDREGRTLCRQALPGAFRVTTPPPKDFRIIAEIPARWSREEG